VPDFTPMGAAGTLPNPQAGLQSLSSIMGVAGQAKQLQLQGQELQQQQLKTKAQTEYSDFLSSFDPSKYIGPDGTLDANGVRTSSEYKGLSLAKPLVDQYIQQVQAGQLSNKQALQTLDNDTLNQMTRGVGALAGDPDVVNDTEAGRQKVTDFYRAFAQQSPEAARISGLYGGVVRHAKQGDLGDAVYAQQLMGADVLGQRTQQQPQALTTGAGVVNRMPRTGEISTPPGAAPGTALNPKPQQVAAATTAATGQGEIDNQRFNAVTQAAAKGQTGVALADQVADLAKQVRTGHLTKEWVDKLTVLKQNDPAITDRQMLAKYAAQLKTTAESGAATDAERSQIDSGMPSPETMNPEAVHDAAQYLHGYFRMNQARGQNAMNHVAQNGTAGLTQKDTAFMQQADPFVYAFKDMPVADKKEFLLKRYGPGGSKDPEGFSAFEKRVKGNAGP